MFLKNNHKVKYDVLTSAFLKELSKSKKDLSKKEIKPETESDEIARIISDKLLEKIQKKIVL
jgi:ribosomal protein S25